MPRFPAAPSWRRAFLRELSRSGSVAAAARLCGIDRSSAYQARRRNAAFAASWNRALAAARARLALLQSPCPFASSEVERHARSVSTDDRMSAVHPEPAEGLDTNGEERVRQKLRLRPNETIRASRAGRPCVVRAGPGRWSVATERAFLAELTASANVAAAARAAGVSSQAAYARRRQWPAFAAAWAEALAAGYVRLETLLLHAATAALEPAACEDPLEMPPPSFDQAMNLLKLHRAAVHGGRAQRYAWRQQEPDIEEVRAEVLRRLAAIERARGAAATGEAVSGSE